MNPAVDSIELSADGVDALRLSRPVLRA